MYTQCPKCETIFRLSADVLRAAGGQVRCGRCGEVFNALARLAEGASAFAKGESSLELETRADEILQYVAAVAPADASVSADDVAPSAHVSASSAPAVAPTEDPAPRAPAAAPSTAAATPLPASEAGVQLQFIDPSQDDPATEASLEFSLPPGELDRIFIETPTSVLSLLAAERHRAAPTRDEPPAAIPPAAAPVLAAAPRATAALPAAAPPSATAAASEAAVQIPAAVHAPPPPVPPLPVTTSPLPQAAGLEVSERVRREMLTSYTHAELPPINAPRRRLPIVAWVAAAAALAVLLGLQLIRDHGDWLAAHVPLLREGVTPAAALSAYQLRQWGVTGDPGTQGSAGALRVRATIMNAAAQLQPYPLLRVTLADRFGTRIAQRDFLPAEYLGKATARMLAPGERADAILDILDPGKDAEGFEIDVCIRSVAKTILCAGDPGARSKP